MKRCGDVLSQEEGNALTPAENINIATLYKKASPDCPAGAGYPPKWDSVPISPSARITPTKFLEFYFLAELFSEPAARASRSAKGLADTPKT